MKTYAGTFSNGIEEVTVDGAPLDPRFDLMLHSAFGFAWGYGGSAPAQLAFAMLADCLGPSEAMRFHHDFKWQVLCHLQPHQSWRMTEVEIRNWVIEAQAERDRSAMALDADRDDAPIED